MAKLKTLDIVPTPQHDDGETLKSSNHQYVETKNTGFRNKCASIFCSIRTIFPILSIGGMILVALLVWSAGFGVSFVGIQQLGNELSELSSQRAVTEITFLFNQARIINENANAFYTKHIGIHELTNKNDTYTDEQFESLYNFMMSQFLQVRGQYASLNILLTNGHIYGVEITSIEQEQAKTVFQLTHDGDTLYMHTTDTISWKRLSNFSAPGVTSYIIPTFESTMEKNKSTSLFFGISSHVVFGSPVTSAARVVRDANGKVFGTVNVILRFDQLTALLKRINPVDTGFMVFLDQENRVGATSLTNVTDIDFSKTCFNATSNEMLKTFCQNLLNDGNKHTAPFTYWHSGFQYYCSPNEIKTEGQLYTVYTVIPSTYFTRSLLVSTGITFGVTGLIILFFVAVSFWLTLSFVNNLRTLSLSFRDIQRLDLNSSVVRRSEKIKSILFEVSTLRDNFRRMKNALLAFTKFVPESVVQSFFYQGLKDSMHPQYVTVFFLDIRNFTNIVETTKPSVLMEEITEIFSGLTDCITKHDGVIVNYIGDAILAIFNAPIPVDAHEAKACQAAIECIKYLNDFEKYSCRIGISAGECNVGIYGSHSKKQFTCLGDIVNLASRLEGLNKFYKTDIIISQNVNNAIQDAFKTRLVDNIRVVGKTESQMVFNLSLGQAWNEDDVEHYSHAMDAFQAGNFIGALENIQKIKEQDEFIKTKENQFQEYIDNPPKHFDGIITMNEK